MTLVTVTTMAEVAVPLPPVAVAVYVVVVDGEMLTEPLGPFTPTPGSISTEVAFDEFHDNVVFWPAVMVVGVAVSCTVAPPLTAGGEVTVNVKFAVAVPPAPVAVAVYVVVDVGVTVAEPEAPCVPIPG